MYMHVSNLLSSGQAQRALEMTCSALALDSENADLCNLAGVCASRLGNMADAEQFWERAIKLNPSISEPYFNLGLLHAGLGRKDKAEGCYRNAIKANPENLDALFNLGTLLLNNSLFDEAELIFLRAMVVAPENPAVYSNLALVSDRKRYLDQAEQFHRKSVSLNKQSSLYRFNLASFLAVSSRSKDTDEAKLIFLDVIKDEPTHFGAWNNLGNLLFETGYTSAAHTAYSAAVTYHPHEATAHVNLAAVLLDRGDLSAAQKHFQIALDLSPTLTKAHQGLASIHQRLGNEKEAAFHRDMGFGMQPLSTSVYRGRGEPIHLLILASALEGNIPCRFLIDSEIFQATAMAIEYFDCQLPLPPHQLIFNAIGDADLCQNGLEIANRLVERTHKPVINHPGAVLQTGRLINANRLANLSGVIVPRMAIIPKSDFYSGQVFEILIHKKFVFPLLLRAQGFHGGNFFVSVDSPDELSSVFAELPGENLLAIEFLDSCSDDSLFRKYRVMSINGCLYPLHMAISTQWKVHYFSSDMEENVKYRNEEERFLDNFSEFLGPSAMSSLERINQALGLEYCGIDFGLDRNGNILLYEANATMVINPAPPEKRWDYKRTAINNALNAARKLFVDLSAS